MTHSDKNSLWQVIDSLRGYGLQADFITVLASLFLLRWADFVDSEEEAAAEFEDREFQSVLPDHLRWQNWQHLPARELEPFISQELLPGIKELPANQTLTRHLGNFADYLTSTSMEMENIYHLVQWLSKQPFETPRDRRRLLSQFDQLFIEAEGNLSLAQLPGGHTPPDIAHLLTALVKPKTGDRIYDPCFGMGFLLTSACDYIRNSESNENTRLHQPCTVAGVEINPNEALIGLVRIILCGAVDPQIELGNALERPQPDNPGQHGFDIALLHSPFGLKVDKSTASHYPIQGRDGLLYFIQHTLAQLQPGGKVAMIVPEGFLFRSGAEEKLRQHLLEKNDLQAIISLPSGSFSYTGIKTNIIILQKGGKSEKIRLINGEGILKKKRRKTALEISPDQLDKIIKLVSSDEQSEFAWTVSVEDFRETDFDLSVKKRNISELDKFFDRLRRGSDFTMGRLGDVCQIISGRSITRNQLVTVPPSVSPAPYIRIKDLEKGRVVLGEEWVNEETTASLRPEYRLKAGDILLSKSGTIGKAAYVTSHAAGAVATSGLFVLRPNTDMAIDSRFLQGYLQSSRCQSWLRDHARGAVVNHLSIKWLKNLQIPFLPLAQQRAAASFFQEEHGDLLDYVEQLFGETDPVISWLHQTGKTLLADLRQKDNPLEFAVFEQVARKIKEVRNQLAYGAGSSKFTAWFLHLSEIMNLCRGMSDIPLGSNILSLLQEMQRGLASAENEISQNEIGGKEARLFHNGLADRVQAALDALYSQVSLEFITNEPVQLAGSATQIKFTLRNASPLALRDLQLTSVPDYGTFSVPFLAEGETCTVCLDGYSAEIKVSGIKMVLYWQGTTLNGMEVRGERGLLFHVEDEQANLRHGLADDLGASPYVTGDALGPDKDVFFGREEQIETIKRQIMANGNVILLEGNRRAGKSSILRHLEGLETIPGWLVVYSSLQGADGSDLGTGVPTVEVFREIATAIAKSLQKARIAAPMPDGSELPPGKTLGINKACRRGIEADAPFADFREYLEEVLAIMADQELGIVLMLDEFDKLQEGIDNKITSPQTPENIRYLVQSYPNFSAILTGSRRLKRLRDEYWSALFGLGIREGVTALSNEAAQSLITVPVKGKLLFTDEAIKQIVDLTAKQPYIIQCLCNQIFNVAAEIQVRSINLDIVTKAAEKLIIDNEHFAALWGYAGTDRRRLLLALCHANSKDGNRISLRDLGEYLAERGVIARDEDIEADVIELMELEVMKKSGSSAQSFYELSIPLMGSWIDRQQDIEALSDKAREEMEGDEDE